MSWHIEQLSIWVNVGEKLSSFHLQPFLCSKSGLQMLFLLHLHANTFIDMPPDIFLSGYSYLGA